MMVRSVTALVLLGVFGGVLWLWQTRDWITPWQVLVLLVMSLGADEWGRLLGLRGWQRVAYPLVTLGVAAGLVLTGRVGFDPIQTLLWRATATPTPEMWQLAGLGETLMIAASAAVLWAVLFAQLREPQAVRTHDALLWGGVGVWVLAVAAYCLLLLPLPVAVLTLGIVAVGDTAAYIFGRWLGRRPLAVAISPGKTWGGLIGAAVAGLGVALLLLLWWQPPLALWFITPLACVGLIVWAALGDLCESLLKRRAGVKDSGRLLPGHGGVLDRIDGLIAAAPVALLTLAALHGLA